MKYLIETALLTHGLKSVADKEILKIWTEEKANLVWVSEGRIVVGDIEQYLGFHTKTDSLIRINRSLLKRAAADRLSGALTASGTMAVCQKMGLGLAVTCGMGGIDSCREEKLCPDLPALKELPVVLISAGPKDMVERGRTIKWLMQQGVLVLGIERDYCTGYIFSGEKVKLDGKYGGVCKAPMLILNEIPEEKRILDRSILEEAVKAGIRAEEEGRYYHPAVNGKIDELTAGYSSRIQLESLLANAQLAEGI